MPSIVVSSKQAEEVAGILLDEGAVLIRPEQPFTFASGVRSPIYCDLRLLMRSPARRQRVSALLAEGVAALCDGNAPDAVAGVATAGIPWAAWTADLMGLPMAYVRDAPKEHGRGQQVEGGLRLGQSAVVVEDLTSTGASAITAVEGLRLIGVRADYVISICTYGSPRAERNFGNAWVRHASLCPVRMVLDVAAASERITPEQHALVMEWLATGPMGG
ncbi:MAG: orotate phosphoribosyltransferase [Chloroflexi bacterium]|nr:orotate phosphoribosyltransferase [Chloroflexota bacterium]